MCLDLAFKKIIKFALFQNVTVTALNIFIRIFFLFDL